MNKDQISRKILYSLNRPYDCKGIDDTTVKLCIDKCNGAIYDTPNLRKMQEIYEYCDNQEIIFHAYWYGKFDRKQAFSLKSLLATQKGYRYRVWLWLDEETINMNNVENQYLAELREKIEVKVYSPRKASESRGFEKLRILMEENSYLAYRADAFRIWVLHEYGGVYFDLDMMFIKDMKNLFCGGEFVCAWEKQIYANNAMIYFRKNSYVNEYILKKAKKHKSFQPWILFTHKDENLKYLRLYPSFLFDPLWGNDNEVFAFHSYEAFFKKASRECRFIEAFPYSYAYHWHNYWKETIEHNSFFEQFEKQFDEILEIEVKHGIR